MPPLHRSITGVVIAAATWLATAGVATAEAEDTVELAYAPAPPGGGAAGLVFDRQRLPAGESFKLRLAVPGTDPVSARLETWPIVGGGCDDHGPQGRQLQSVAMRVSGENATRVLEATVAPLQIQVRQCFEITVERGVTDQNAAVLGGRVNAQLQATTPWMSRCRALPAVAAAGVAHDLKTILPAAVAALPVPLAGGVGGPPDQAVLDAAIEIIVQALAIETHCREIDQARLAHDTAAHALAPAQAGLAAALAKLQQLATTAATSRGYTRPLGFVKSGTTVRPILLGDLAQLSKEAIADNLTIVPDPALVAHLSAINAATTDPARAAARAALTAALAAPLVLGDVSLYLPNTGEHVTLASLVPGSAPFARFAQAVSGAHLVAILDQLRTLRRQHAQNAFLDQWIAATGALITAEAAQVKALDDVARLAAALPALEQGSKLATAFAAAIASAPVRALLRGSITYTAATPTDRPTDDTASWWTPTAGVLVGLPIVHEAGALRVAEPWLTPYAGVSFYRRRVDRVIDPDDLIGDVTDQRLSLTVGTLLGRPDLRGKDVTGPWDAAVIPYLGAGYRMSEFLRVDAGFVGFMYAHRNPVVKDLDWGAALYLGVSIDADVWAAINGKLVK